MRFSIHELQKLVNLKTTPEKLAQQLTDSGLEVEEVSGDIIEVAVPPNRADCLGLIGIAREAAAINDFKFTPPEVSVVNAAITDKINLQVTNQTACPKYLGRIIKNIDNSVPTPQWMQDYLTVANVKTISAVVDITNYVMLEYSQPLHAFDLTKIANGSVVVRNAKAGESIALLDGSTKQLDTETLVIADAVKPLALAGIMGGTESSISLNSKDILVECAYFDPITIRLSARRYGLQTDGSYRHERSIDPVMQQQVMERVTQLLLDVVGGQAGPVVTAIAESKIAKPIELLLRSARITKILGINIPTTKVSTILQQLGMQVKSIAGNDDLMVTVPTFRTDISREIDLIEEVARIYGLNNITAQLPIGTLAFNSQPEEVLTEEKIINCLVNRGYNEAINYSFIDLELAKNFVTDINTNLILTNPISADMSLMRPSLLPGLINALLRNKNRQQDRVRLFEIGLRFNIDDSGNLQQIKTISSVCCGKYLPENWASSANQVDFFDLKADISALFKLGNNNLNLQFIPSSDPAMHPGQCADIILAGTKVGKMGTLHPALQQTLDLDTKVYLFELDYAAIENGQVPKFNLFSKFPAVRRDIALLVDKDLAAAKIEQAIRNKIGGLLADLVMFDVYEGPGVVAGKKSLGLGLTLQHVDRTLQDAEVNTIFENLLVQLETEFNAILR